MDTMTGAELRASGSSSAGSEARIGVVVPLFKHSVLVGDALASLIDQIQAPETVIIVVNDGCPFGDSDWHVQAIRGACRGIILSILRPNGGLSAARNTGIDVLMDRFPSIEAIYFMDADNRLRPKGLAAASARLAASGADWVYPHIDMFGCRENYDYGGPYSLLRHAFHNLCEAGSLVHRRVFAAGLRFDEAMRDGFEDWDFWLSAAAAGFRGVHEPHFGFEYRNRAESMLAQSKRDTAAILSYLRAKHPRLWDAPYLLALEEHEAPRHALIRLDTGDVTLGGAHLTRAAFDRLLWRNLISPGEHALPPFLIFTTQAVIDRLAHHRLLPWVLYDLQLGLADHSVVAVTLASAPGNALAIGAGASAAGADLLATTRPILAEVLMAPDTGWIESLAKPQPDMRVTGRMVTLPWQGTGQAPGPAGSAVFGMLFQILQWRGSAFRQAAEQRWSWRTRSLPVPHEMVHELTRRFEGGVTYCPPAARGRSIGFVLRIGAHGGVERVAFNIAGVFAARGWTAHLFMLGTDRVEIPPDVAATFTTINFLAGNPAGEWNDGRLYLGTALPTAEAEDATARRLAAALSWLDVVVNEHCATLNCAAALLRRAGTIMVTHLHLLDQSPLGRPVGHPALALAYEHGYDLVLCGSRDLLGWTRAAGIPADKLILVQNAPGHPLDAAQRMRILSQRRERQRDRLHVLFLGRLDRQKGIDRLAAVIEGARSLGLALAWRIVGAPTLDTQDLPDVVRDLAEPPVLSADALTAVFAWADVLLLLSDFEGVPLTIPEAQRLGVCVIATDVGAVSEVITPGRTGLLVPPETAVANTLELLTSMVDSPWIAREIGRMAAASVPDWQTTTRDFVAWVEAQVKDGRTALFDGMPEHVGTGQVGAILQDIRVTEGGAINEGAGE